VAGQVGNEVSPQLLLKFNVGLHWQVSIVVTTGGKRRFSASLPAAPWKGLRSASIRFRTASITCFGVQLALERHLVAPAFPGFFHHLGKISVLRKTMIGRSANSFLCPDLSA